MKKALSAMMLFALLGCMNSVVLAAELLDVKPVVAGDAVSFEISADIAMTYTYYNIPGQTRAVVDIAEADPERIEPLIVVNKGVVSSISVDKARISGIVVSRIIFNLVSESEIIVSSNPDRKLLTVTFAGSTAAVKPEPKPEPVQVPNPAQPPEAVVKSALPAIVATTPPIGAGHEDALTVLDKQAVKSVPPLNKAAVVESGAPLPAVPQVMRIPKLEPVVPVVSARPQALTVKEIVTGASYVEIRTNQPVSDYKATRITGPDRLVIDIAGEKINQKPKTVAIKKFGILKARIGVSPKHIRIVMDSGKAGFPSYTITTIDEGLRINFK
jgi:hypothetical protein